MDKVSVQTHKKQDRRKKVDDLSQQTNAFHVMQPAIYSMITDSETGRIRFEPDTSSQAAMYNTESLKMVIEQLPGVHAQAAKKLIEVADNTAKFIQDNPNPTKEDYLDQLKLRVQSLTIEEVKAEMGLFHYILEHKTELNIFLQKIQNPIITDKDTFKDPADSGSDVIRAAFRHSPRNTKKHKGAPRIVTDKDEIAKYDGMLNVSRSGDTSLVILNDDQDKPLVAVYPVEYFHPKYSVQELENRLCKIFGPDGVRNLDALKCCIEEQLPECFDFEKGIWKKPVVWYRDEHLKRMNYKKGARGSYDTGPKEIASNFMRVIMSFQIAHIRKDSIEETARIKPLIMVNDIEMKRQFFETKFITSMVEFYPTDWYTKALLSTSTRSAQYGRKLKKAPQISSKNHWPAIFLLDDLTPAWRRECGPVSIKVKTTMEKCRLNVTGTHKYDDLQFFESEIKYLVEEGHASKFEIRGSPSKSLSDQKDPFECVVIIYPPDFYNQKLDGIKENRNQPHRRQIRKHILSREQINSIYKKSGLSINKFAEFLGYSQPYITMVLNGKRDVSKELSNQVNVLFKSTFITSP